MKLYFFLVSLFFCLTAVSQNPKEKIQWDENQRLTVEDFKASPPKNISYAGNANSGMTYSWSFSTQSGTPVLKYEVTANFYPNLSWLKEKVDDQEYLLAHEQMHFDITELHARKLRKALAGYEIGPDIKKELNKLYEKYEKQRVAMQKQFDKETNHSQNKEAEAKWRAFVAKELQKLQEFSS